jgi:hypothetical protein
MFFSFKAGHRRNSRRDHDTGCVPDRAARLARDTGPSAAFPFDEDTDPRHRFAILEIVPITIVLPGH